MNGQDITIWVDTSSLATSVVIEKSESIAEDASWLRLVYEDRHINLVELNMVLRGINLALQRKASVIHLQTNLACVHHWISDTLTGNTRERTREVSKMLIRHLLTNFWELASEYGLVINVAFVKSHANQAD